MATLVGDAYDETPLAFQQLVRSVRDHARVTLGCAGHHELHLEDHLGHAVRNDKLGLGRGHDIRDGNAWGGFEERGTSVRKPDHGPQDRWQCKQQVPRAYSQASRGLVAAPSHASPAEVSVRVTTEILQT